MPLTESLIDISKQLQQFEKVCRAAGLKLTHQRMEIFQDLLSSTDHPSAETLHKRLAKRLPTLSLDTVYRTLGTFEKFDLIQRIETLESQARFEALKEQHHHFLCDNCGKVVDFHWPDFDKMELPDDLKKVGSIDRKNVVIHGQCADCLTNRSQFT